MHTAFWSQEGLPTISSPKYTLGTQYGPYYCSKVCQWLVLQMSRPFWRYQNMIVETSCRQTAWRRGMGGCREPIEKEMAKGPPALLLIPLTPRYLPNFLWPCASRPSAVLWETPDFRNTGVNVAIKHHVPTSPMAAVWPPGCWHICRLPCLVCCCSRPQKQRHEWLKSACSRPFFLSVWQAVSYFLSLDGLPLFLPTTLYYRPPVCPPPCRPICYIPQGEIDNYE